MSRALVLDVGHAGCTIIRTSQRTVVVDAGNSTVVEVLEQLELTRVDQLILSHRHRDHTSGAYTLLSDPTFEIGKVFVNPDPSASESDARAINRAVNLAWATNRTVKQDVNSTTTQDLSQDDLAVEVLWPDVAHSNAGISGTTGNGPIGSHDLAVVLRISDWDGRSVLLCADASRAALEELIQTEPERMRADVLVWPHHGGRSTVIGTAAAERDFAELLTRTVEPELVIFSTGRGRHDNPRSEVVSGVRSAGASTRIACTQINTRCGDPVHIGRKYSGHGSSTGHSCAGTIELNLRPGGDLEPGRPIHIGLVGDLASPACAADDA